MQLLQELSTVHVTRPSRRLCRHAKLSEEEIVETHKAVRGLRRHSKLSVQTHKAVRAGDCADTQSCQGRRLCRHTKLSGQEIV